MSASPLTIRDTAWHVWAHIAHTLAAAATAAGHTSASLAALTGLDLCTVRRSLNKQSRLTIETFVTLSLALGLHAPDLMAAALAAVPEPVTAA